MLPIICCRIEMFKDTQTISIFDGEKETKLADIDYELAGATIAQYCHNMNTNKIHLFGQEEYIESLIDDIRTTNFFMYKNEAQVLEIEVN